MKKIKTLLISLLVIFTSCKEEKTVDEIKEIKKNVFIVEMNISNKDKDVICLYYKDNSITYFNNDMAIYKNIEKSDIPQNIIFELPEDFLPNDFRFDLSHENQNQTMIVNNITFTYEGQNFKINNLDLEKYFSTNEGVIFNENDRSYSFQKMKDGSYDPFLTTTGQFYPLLEKLVGYGAFQPSINVK